MIKVVLVEPENSGNIGAVARAMANFDLMDLVLVDPKADHLCHEAVCRSKHAKKVLENAEVISKKEMYDFDCVIGTTAKTGTDYNIPRSPLNPDELAELIKDKHRKGLEIALMFGREGKGLSNSEVRKCDFVVKIDASDKYGTLNLSHACTIIFYEIFKTKKVEKKVEYAKKAEKDVLLKLITDITNTLEFSTKDKKETQKKVWKRVIGKSFLTKREAFALIGFFKKLRKP